ncbi:MAG: phosphoribosylformylglycinamidine synthase [Bacteroidales bacterium]|nr:phosphoribosylformylglycinamidine synthase [Lentimicrobiaceae bacterium]MDD5694976.1 phosphoribosylformylglycinamidine synthase [Bacteroidales bacterium]
MVIFFTKSSSVFAVDFTQPLKEHDLLKLRWLFGNARIEPVEILKGYFIGPRKEMITPWSTNAVEITQNMGIDGIQRMEEFRRVAAGPVQFDPMLQAGYHGLDQLVFTVDKPPEPLRLIDDIATYNLREGLSLSGEEVSYLEKLCQKLNRRLTDTEVFGFSQVNSEHCRHKIFNGVFILNGEPRSESLFDLIRKTSRIHPNRLVSAYIDNCALISGPVAHQFAPARQDRASFFEIRDIETVLSLKAETHNFPTTVEPFNGAATGTGGEIRDRMAGGKGSIPMAGTAVYMTSYPRLESGRPWERHIEPRQWLYKTPEDILIKASNGASDFGNKFGQPLICGSLLTFEYTNGLKQYGYDKVIMLAGGIGYARKEDSFKDLPEPGDVIVVMGGDNYRIGMGGGAVSSVATGEYGNTIELNAVQRSNPEMQKRVANALRALTETVHNPVIAIHDHGAGGHLNAISELVEKTGGRIFIRKLPIGDSTLSSREIMGNESQERMGLILRPADVPLLKAIAQRERAPMYIVGEVTGDLHFEVIDEEEPIRPIHLHLNDMFGKPPRTVIEDETHISPLAGLVYAKELVHHYLEQVLQLESVACKDWLTNKVDRSVTGKVVMQQTTGPLQLPLNNLGVVALDYRGAAGIATAIGHAPVAGLINPEAGSVLSVAEALTNLIWAPLADGIRGVSLSANWMWPAKNPGEDERLYRAVEAVSRFAIDLGINVPTGKDSLSMTQKYPGGRVVFAPGTLIISAMSEVTDVRKIITPVPDQDVRKKLIYIDLSRHPLEPGGSSFAQILGQLGNQSPTVQDPAYFVSAFNTIQSLIGGGKISAGHDVSAGGMIVTLLEMAFTRNDIGMDLDLTGFNEPDLIKCLFSENPGVIIQADPEGDVMKTLNDKGIGFHVIGQVCPERQMTIRCGPEILTFDIDSLRDLWYKSSYLLDRNQTPPRLALDRYRNYKHQPLTFTFSHSFQGRFGPYAIVPERKFRTGIPAAIIREKGVNGDREMAWSLHLAGFDVKDVHMTDLVAGKEDLRDVHFIIFVGGFSNSDVLGSGKGWAGAFLFNPRAKRALERFFQRNDTLSLGMCNGCQVLVELGLIYPGHRKPPRMLHNESGKFESAFVNVDIMENHSVMLHSLAGSRLGIWVSHSEGRFELPYAESRYHIPVKYSYSDYPGNPNGSQYRAAAICSADGRHLAMMPHMERAIYPWQWPCYPETRRADEVSPWIEAFVNARDWIKKNSEL